MKRRTSIFLSAIVCALLIFSVSNSFADVEVKVARIDLVGSATLPSGRPPINLTDMSATPKWTGSRQFFISDTIGNSGLATALTALSLEKTVWVVIADPGTSGSLIKNIYVSK